jgi:hypothetical protein
MPSPSEMRLADLREKYKQIAASRQYTRLYESDSAFGHMFAVLHEQLNSHFTSINDRAKTTQHYWADPSRALLGLIDDIKQDLHELSLAGVDVILLPEYEKALEDAGLWLSPSGGSTVPDDYKPVDVRRYDRVFTVSDGTVHLETAATPSALKMVGSGSYANVYSYVDPNYDIKFAVKRAKRGISDRDLQRFRQEFDVMKSLSFPYVVQVFRFDEVRNEYRMEFCDDTLRAYISKRNATLSFSSRKRMALQFLYGMNYIHSQGHLHRDVSLQNVLIKLYASEAVLVKLSDFGLVKAQASTFTRTETDMRGTIRDPVLHDFKSYSLVNEMYSIGWVLSYIFSGRESLLTGEDEVAKVVQKCTAHDVNKRFASVLELIGAVERLAAAPAQTSA